MKRLTLLTVATLACALLSACNKSASPSASTDQSDGKLTIAFLPKSKGNAYFVACKKGADEAAKELGVELLFDGPTQTDPAKQNEIVESWITSGVDVIAAACENREGISTAVFNARFVKPIDEAMLEAIGLRFKNVLTIEENSVKGGFGSAVAEFFAQKGFKSNIRIHGIPDEFIEHGAPAELLKDINLDRAGIAKVARDLVKSSNTERVTS